MGSGEAKKKRKNEMKGELWKEEPRGEGDKKKM